MLCNQLAQHESVPAGSQFVPKAAPDAGIESYWILSTGSEWGFQAKFFTSPPDGSQWGQIDDSVATALAKHPNLTKYTICLPIDRADPRIPKQNWFKDEWDKHVEKWNKWAAGKQRSVAFTYWGETEIAGRLSVEQHAGRYFFWFSKDLFTDQWFEDQLNRTIADAGPRYTPEVNVCLPIDKVFDGLYRHTRFFADLAGYRREIKKYARFSPTEADAFATDEIALLNQEATKLLQVLDTGIATRADAPVEFAAITAAIEGTRAAIFSYEGRLARYEETKREEAKKKGTPTEEELNRQPSMYADTNYYIRRLLSALYELGDFCDGNPALAANSNAVLVTGNGGCGKTHLLCDIASRRLCVGAPSILLLGQHFYKGSPWKQILDQLGLDCKPDHFLSALEIAGQLRGQITMFAIDALNEGDGRTLWRNHLAGLLTDLRRFPGIRASFSVRSTYEALCIPGGIAESDLLSVFHPGFADHEYVAAKTFFAFYKIKQPSVPLLVPEFQNPLFLKTFCKALNNEGRTEIPNGLHGITAVFNFFIRSINHKLSEPEYLDYDSLQQPVSKAVNVIADIMAADKKAHVDRAKAQQAVDQLLPRDGYGKSLFFHLLGEGLLTENRMPAPDPEDEWIDVVIFAYERFTDHLIAKRLLDQHVDASDPEAAFGTGGPLHHLVANEGRASFNRGLLEALSIQVPERFSREFPDLVPHARAFQAMRSAFLDSIALRDTLAFSDATDNYINSTVLAYAGGWDDLIEVLLTVSTNPAHPHNARLLHAYLLPKELAERDALWTIRISNKQGKQGAVDRLLDWASSPEDKGYIEDESLELCGIVLGWFLTSPNRTLRDRATKALVHLFAERLTVLQRVLEQFSGVNDPYVAERMWCAAYGCALRSHDDKGIAELAQLTYDHIFKGRYPFPNILLRDYARGIVELALQKNLSIRVIKKRIRPPYLSELSDHAPSMNELEAQFGWSGEKSDDSRRAWLSIVSSVMHGGDFERYVIGTNSGTFPWSSRPIDSPSPTAKNRVEREPFSLELARRWIFNRVVELGWTPERFGSFDRSRSSHDRRPDKSERMGKKYQWIAYYEFVARVADNFQYAPSYHDSRAKVYEGPWQVSYARNIDPSCLLTSDVGDDDSQVWWSPLVYVPSSDVDAQDWVKMDSDLPPAEALLQVRNPVDDSTWLVLQTHRNFEEPSELGGERYDRPFKQVWYMVQSYLVRRSDEGRLIGWLSKKSFWGRWMPESTEEYKVFLGEFFRSPAYHAHDDAYHGHGGWTKGQDLPAKVCVTAEGYLHERVYDCSISDSIRLLLPAKAIVEGMRLHWRGEVARFCGPEGDVVTFDPAALEPGPHALLIKQSALKRFLDEQGLSLIWTILGAKHWMTGSIQNEKWIGELQMSGLYRLANDVPSGSLRSEWVGPGN